MRVNAIFLALMLARMLPRVFAASSFCMRRVTSAQELYDEAVTARAHGSGGAESGH